MEYLLADKGYDSDTIVTKAEEQGARVVIPPRKNRKHPREYDKALYKLRHLVENAFLHLKRWRGIATRYAKNLSSFVAGYLVTTLSSGPSSPAGLGRARPTSDSLTSKLIQGKVCTL